MYACIFRMLIGQGQLVSLDYCIWTATRCLLDLLSFLCVLYLAVTLNFVFFCSFVPEKDFLSLPILTMTRNGYFFFKLIHEHNTSPNKMLRVYSTGLSIRERYHLSHTGYLIFTFSFRWTGPWTRFCVKQGCSKKPQLRKYRVPFSFTDFLCILRSFR